MKMEQKDIAAKIAVWKKKFGDIYVYEADGKKCYLHRPSRAVVSAASVIGKEDPFKFAEVVLENCWLDGDECLRTDDAYFMGLSQQISQLVEIKTGQLKKL